METIIISVIATIISLISLVFCAVTFYKQYGKSLYIQLSYRNTFLRMVINIQHSVLVWLIPLSFLFL